MSVCMTFTEVFRTVCTQENALGSELRLVEKCARFLRTNLPIYFPDDKEKTKHVNGESVVMQNNTVL